MSVRFGLILQVNIEYINSYHRLVLSCDVNWKRTDSASLDENLLSKAMDLRSLAMYCGTGQLDGWESMNEHPSQLKQRASELLIGIQAALPVVERQIGWLRSSPPQDDFCLIRHASNTGSAIATALSASKPIVSSCFRFRAPNVSRSAWRGVGTSWASGQCGSSGVGSCCRSSS